jgi:hypothetical protein
MAEKRAFLETFNSMSPQMKGALIGGLVGAGGAALFGKRKNMLQNMLMFGGLGAAGGYGLGGYMKDRIGSTYGKGFQAGRMVSGLNSVAKDPNARQAVTSTAAAPLTAAGAATGNPLLTAAGQLTSLAGNRNTPTFFRNAYNNAKTNLTPMLAGMAIAPKVKQYAQQGVNAINKGIGAFNASYPGNPVQTLATKSQIDDLAQPIQMPTNARVGQ